MSLASLSNSTCTIQRNVDAAVVGDYNTPVPANYQDKDVEIRCRYAPKLSNVRGLGGFVGERWASNTGDIIHDVVLVLLPPGTDINEDDRITNIRDEQGSLIEDGPLDLLLVRKTFRGRSEHHTSVVAKKIT